VTKISLYMCACLRVVALQISAGLGPIMEVMSPLDLYGDINDDAIREAAADLCCEVASNPLCRPGLAEAGAMKHLAGLLYTTSNNEVR
jgi:hypothetical protein